LGTFIHIKTHLERNTESGEGEVVELRPQTTDHVSEMQFRRFTPEALGSSGFTDVMNDYSPYVRPTFLGDSCIGM